MTYIGRSIGYLRVSRSDQCLDRQIDGLVSQCDEMRIERISAAAKSRPVFDELVGSLQSGDTLVVWDIDRAFRSTIDAVQQAQRLRERGIGFRIVTLNVDTGTPDGMLVYTMMAAISEHERKRLSQRTKEGLASARKRGKRLGRPPKLNERQLERARDRLQCKQESIKAVAASLGIAPWSLTRSLRRARKESSAARE